MIDTIRPIICHECVERNVPTIEPCEHVLSVFNQGFEKGRSTAMITDDLSVDDIRLVVEKLNDYMIDLLESDEARAVLPFGDECPSLFFEMRLYGEDAAIFFHNEVIWESVEDPREEVLNERKIYVPEPLEEYIRRCLRNWQKVFNYLNFDNLFVKEAKLEE